MFVEWNDEQGSSLKLRAADSGKDKVIVRTRGVIRQPMFSRDGKRIAYRIMEPTGLAQFSPDDKRIYFFASADSSQLLWLLGRDLYATAPGDTGLVTKPERTLHLSARPMFPMARSRSPTLAFCR